MNLRLPANPSRVDKLIVDQFREHAKVCNSTSAYSGRQNVYLCLLACCCLSILFIFAVVCNRTSEFTCVVGGKRLLFPLQLLYVFVLVK